MKEIELYKFYNQEVDGGLYVLVNGQRFNIVSESKGILKIRRPNGSKTYLARRLGNEAIFGANRAKIIADLASHDEVDTLQKP